MDTVCLNIGVVGLWHLGTVTSACLASLGHNVTAYDPDHALITNLQQGITPISEPGLDDLINQEQNESKRLVYTAEASALNAVDIIWITFDTPLNADNQPDAAYVENQIKNIIPQTKPGAIILVSSQLPVGSTRKLIDWCNVHHPEKQCRFGCSPENLRLGKAIEVFMKQERVVVGTSDDSMKPMLTDLLSPIAERIEWMSVESAEMTKHALNAFLATSIVFINEISTLCEQVGADAHEVSRGLKSDIRIGKRAYLQPGNAIAGGTLLRDINYLIEKSNETEIPALLCHAILDANEAHKRWAANKVKSLYTDLSGKKITLLGLSYKTGTDTLRHSLAIEIAQMFHEAGAKVVGFDSDVSALPDSLNGVIEYKPSLDEALSEADVAIVTKFMPELSQLTENKLCDWMGPQPMVLDANGIVNDTLHHGKTLSYHKVGV